MNVQQVYSRCRHPIPLMQLPIPRVRERMLPGFRLIRCGNPFLFISRLPDFAFEAAGGVDLHAVRFNDQDAISGIVGSLEDVLELIVPE